MAISILTPKGASPCANSAASQDPNTTYVREALDFFIAGKPRPLDDSQAKAGYIAMAMLRLAEEMQHAESTPVAVELLVADGAPEHVTRAVCVAAGAQAHANNEAFFDLAREVLELIAHFGLAEQAAQGSAA